MTCIAKVDFLKIWSRCLNGCLLNIYDAFLLVVKRYQATVALVRVGLFGITVWRYTIMGNEWQEEHEAVQCIAFGMRKHGEMNVDA